MMMVCIAILLVYPTASILDFDKLAPRPLIRELFRESRLAQTVPTAGMSQRYPEGVFIQCLITEPQSQSESLPSFLFFLLSCHSFSVVSTRVTSLDEKMTEKHERYERRNGGKKREEKKGIRKQTTKEG